MCREALPTGMLSRLTRLAADLMEWAQQHRDAPLAEQEQAVLGLPDLLGAVLPLCASALSAPVAGLQQPCPQCGKRQRQGSHDGRERQMSTVCGVVRSERPYYYRQHCQQMLHSPPQRCSCPAVPEADNM